MREVKITIDEAGNATIETTGFQGQACEKFTAELEKALGKVEKNTRTPEYFQQATKGQQARTGQGQG